jgi:hypothetical protein
MKGGRWLLLGALALIALVIVLWMQLNAPVAAAEPPPIAPAAAAQPAVVPAPAPVAQAMAKVAAKADDGKPKKIDPASDEFFNRFTDVVPVVLSREAMQKCYHGGLHRRDRDQSITIDFVDHIKDGEVTVSNLKIKMSNLNDKELEDCIMSVVAKAHWHDDSLPDTTQDDQFTLNPERGGKKYTKENLDYEGPMAPNR